MIALFIHNDATADLLALRRSDPKAAGRIMALLEQLQGDLDLMDRLTQHDYGAYESEDFHVSKWQEQYRKGRDLWRLKVWDLENTGTRFRVIYAFEPRTHHYHVLAIAPREFNYDKNHLISRRIIRAYEEL